MKNLFFIILVIVVAIVSAAIALLPAFAKGDHPSAKSLPPDSLPNEEKAVEVNGMNASQSDGRLVASNTRFGLRLYSQLTKANGEKNLFLSPASIAFALTMTYNGAQGETQRAMQRALELQGLTLAEINAANAQLKTALENLDRKVKLEIANSLWANQGVAFQPDFIARNKEFFKAEVATLNFHDPRSSATINSWVKQKTKGKIDKIVDQISADTLLFLINAIYFKGMWTNKFDPAQTTDMPFHLLGGVRKQHPMMTQSGEFSYFETEQFQAIALPYGDRQTMMYIFLPKEGRTLAAFQQSLNPENWERWMSSFVENKGRITLPRFKVEYEVSLNDVLDQLGMGIAFTDNADFSAMVKPPTQAFISQVKHKAFAEVNEEGTEAAAVTSVQMRTTSARIAPKPFQMIVDRPFFFAIRDTRSGSLLFMGSIVDPVRV